MWRRESKGWGKDGYLRIEKGHHLTIAIIPSIMHGSHQNSVVKCCTTFCRFFIAFSFLQNFHTHLFVSFMDLGDEAARFCLVDFNCYAALWCEGEKARDGGENGSVRIEMHHFMGAIISMLMHGAHQNSAFKCAWAETVLEW